MMQDAGDSPASVFLLCSDRGYARLGFCAKRGIAAQGGGC